MLQYDLFYVLLFLATRRVDSFGVPDQGPNLHPLHWKVKSLAQNYKGSPSSYKDTFPIMGAPPLCLILT